MEDRINKIELDLAIMAKTQQTMSESLTNISKTLDSFLLSYSEVKILQQRIDYIDKETRESFVRANNRTEKLESVVSRVTWTMLTPILVGLIAILISKGGI
jgi:hypothetical protein